MIDFDLNRKQQTSKLPSWIHSKNISRERAREGANNHKVVRFKRLGKLLKTSTCPSKSPIFALSRAIFAGIGAAELIQWINRQPKDFTIEIRNTKIRQRPLRHPIARNLNRDKYAASGLLPGSALPCAVASFHAPDCRLLE